MVKPKTYCMTKNITQDNLIRYIYSETTAEETSLIEEALRSDWELKELHDNLLETKSELSRVKVSPSQKVIDTASHPYPLLPLNKKNSKWRRVRS